MLQSLTNFQQWMRSRRRETKLKGIKRSTRRRIRYYSRSPDLEGSTKDSNSSSHKEKKKRRYRNSSRDEYKKERLPIFNGEINNGQEAKSWILGMRKYFQLHDYLGNMKARVAIFNLTGRTSIWWEHFRQVKKINERKIVWKQF